MPSSPERFCSPTLPHRTLHNPACSSLCRRRSGKRSDHNIPAMPLIRLDGSAEVASPQVSLYSAEAFFSSLPALQHHRESLPHNMHTETMPQHFGSSGIGAFWALLLLVSFLICTLLERRPVP